MSAEDRLAAGDRRTGAALRAALWPNVGIWVLLMALLFASLGLAYLPLGDFNLPVALAIAAAQGGLVVAFFMDLRRASTLILLAASAAVLFVAVMFTLTFNDLFHRF